MTENSIYKHRKSPVVRSASSFALCAPKADVPLSNFEDPSEFFLFKVTLAQYFYEY